MPIQGKWLTDQNAFRFIHGGELLLFPGPTDFPLFTAFFLLSAAGPACPFASLKQESIFKHCQARSLLFYRKEQKGSKRNE